MSLMMIQIAAASVRTGVVLPDGTECNSPADSDSVCLFIVIPAPAGIYSEYRSGRPNWCRKGVVRRMDSRLRGNDGAQPDSCAWLRAEGCGSLVFPWVPSSRLTVAPVRERKTAERAGKRQPSQKRLFHETNPNSIENKGRLEEQSQSKPKTKPLKNRLTHLLCGAYKDFRNKVKHLPYNQ